MINIRHWETGKAVLYVESSKSGNLPFVGTGEGSFRVTSN